MTRIQQDLSSSPHQEDYLETNGTNSPMIRSALGRIPHVCVVGAGVAGLRCAAVLLQHGAKVTILEGRDRVGGRLCQGKIAGHLVDLGPNWIHGTDNNPMLDLAKETDTKTISWDGRQAVFDDQGYQMPTKDATENTEIVWSIIEQAMKHSNDDSAAIPAEKSLHDYFEEQVKIIFPSEMEGDKEAKRKQETILQMSEMWGAFVGSPIQKQSLKYFWLEECIDGENLFVAGTYHKILEKIVEPVAKSADIKFSHKVKKIVSNEVGEGEDPKVTVDVEGKGSFTFDEVVMTAPLGWLKRNLSAFTPEIPKRLKEGIEAIGYGHLDKVYFTFPTAFWNESSTLNTTVSAVTHDQTLPNVTATTAPHHQSMPSKSDSPVNPAHFPGFAHWTYPRYAHSKNPSHWNQEVVNLAALPAPTAHSSLLFYIYGPISKHIADLLSSNPPSAHTAVLTDFFHPYFSRLPNYDPSNPSHQPSDALATVWVNDELAGYGSYANFQVGLERGDQDVEVMRRGLPERGVWLAGEHTAPFVALGTVTGAWWAGEGVGKRISRAYGLKKTGDIEAEGSEEIQSNGHAEVAN